MTYDDCLAETADRLTEGYAQALATLDSTRMWQWTFAVLERLPEKADQTRLVLLAGSSEFSLMAKGGE